MTILYCKTGWMKRYQGPAPDDPKPIGDAPAVRRANGALHSVRNRMIQFQRSRVESVYSVTSLLGSALGSKGIENP